MDIQLTLKTQTILALETLYGLKIDEVSFEKTNPNFAGDLTLVVFPFLRFSKKKPEDTATDIGEFLQQNVGEISGYNIVKGFLNIELSNDYWLNVAETIATEGTKIPAIGQGQKVVVEYSSPNTNKPLHLGHVRNNVLGFSYCKILEANGYEVVKNNLVNDRGIHICKSMLAWQKWGNGETPESSGTKGDHLVGKYYVQFETKFQEEYRDWIESAEGKSHFDTFSSSPAADKLRKENEDLAKGFKSEYKNTYFNKQSVLGAEVKSMLQKWEDGNNEVITCLLYTSPSPRD